VEKGIILVADDQYMNLEALKINLQEINKIKKAEFYVNG
jgi:CheY-like chemotaxis protein